MSEINVVLERLKKLDLTFEEAVYAVAFQLLDKIEEKDKEVVFRELPCRERMTKNVSKALPKWYSYAIKMTLGYDTSVDEEVEFGHGCWDTVEECFKDAMRFMGIESRYLRLAHDVEDFRYQLLGGGRLWTQPKAIPISEVNVDTDFLDAAACLSRIGLPDLYAELQQLMNEVRFYDKKREQALATIEALLEEVKKRTDCPKDLAMPDESQDAAIDMQGSIEQIRWSYRSLVVLRSLELTLAEAVEYFSDWNNFIQATKITLWEWTVICAVLRQERLLYDTEKVEVRLQDELGDIYGNNVSMNTRVSNSLRRGGRIDTVGDLVSFFAIGAKRGWKHISRFRDFGPSCRRYLAYDMLGAWSIIISPELCNPTGQDLICALDLDLEAQKTLDKMQVRTIGELIAACEDENRFSGLRYINSEVYGEAMEHLEKYGFNVNC